MKNDIKMAGPAKGTPDEAQATPMPSKSRSRLWLAVISTAILLGFGCASPNVNPPVPGVNTGYIDFYVQSSEGLAWEVQGFDSAANRFKTLFSNLEPIKDGVLRLAFKPGTQQVRVTFLNRVIMQPAVLDVTVHDGQITPVQVTLTEADTVSVSTRQETMGRGARGYYGRRYEFGSYDTKSFKLTAVAQPPKAYTPKPPGRNSP